MNVRSLRRLLALLLCGAAHAADLTTDGLTVTLDDAAVVRAMTLQDAELRVDPRPLITLCAIADGSYRAPTVGGGSLQDGLSLRFAEAKATATLTVASRKGALSFACRLKGDDLPARGMLLRFAFPFDATGWRWHSDMQTSAVMGEAGVYENARPLRAWADLPEWKDQPDLRMGYSNRNFCTVVTGPVGLCLAVPIDRPCIFRTAYDAKAKRLQIVYDFALSPDTREPNQVAFAFDLYPCDPHWGFRDALARYYKLYPQLFANMVKEPGQWMAFSRLSEIDNANEFCFGLQEGAPEPEYDDKIAVLSAPYLTHAGQFARIPGHDPEKEPLPPFDVQLKAMDAAFKRRTGKDGIYRAVGLHTATGKLDIHKTRVYGHIISQFNLDPELPYGAWTLENAVARTEGVRKRSNAVLDGFYYDGLSAGINYRPEHFKTADAPCLWDPAAKKPLINNFFSSCEFARAAAELLRPRGQITMMNGALGASFYVAPWLDLLGAETGLRISRERFNYIRATTYHKPFLTLLKGNYEQKVGRAEIELFMKRCLAYGVFPGFFDWPPSGLGPGGRYWDHARYYERDRDLHRKYQPLCRTLAMAGWEPVTYARSSEPAVFVERFGPAPDRPEHSGIVWLTLLNEDSQPHKTIVAIGAAALGLDVAETKALDVLAGTAVPLVRLGDILAAELEVPADGVVVMQLTTPAEAARWRLAQAVDTLDRGARMREVDSRKPPIAVHWRPRGKAYVRQSDNGRPHLAFVGDGETAQSASQWAMLFQPKPAPLTLRVRAKADGIEGRAAISCRLAWVTPSFTHYENRSFALTAGTYGWKDFEFAIASEHPLRSIQVTPQIDKRVKGTLSLARLSLSDANREDYIVDPKFQHWYDPVPEAMREPLRSECKALRSALAELEARDDPADPTHRRHLLAAFERCASLRALIAKQEAENGCRRVLRDLDTIEGHLGLVALAMFDIPPPRIQGPTTATAGDSVLLRFMPPVVPEVDTQAELSCQDAELDPIGGGASVLVPADAAPGSVITVTGRLHIARATVSTEHRITVVPPLELALRHAGTDVATGACRLRLGVRNHRRRPLTARIAVHAPEGWKADVPATLTIAPSAGASAEAVLTPVEGAAPGAVEVAASVAAGDDAASARLTLLYIPMEANLLTNPGFEQAAEGWHRSQGSSEIDRAVTRSGKAALRLDNPTATDTTVSQTVLLNQKTPCPILVRASSKAKGVSGAPGKGYSLYIDIYYTDGTPLYGQTHSFQTGTTDWQLGELYIEPAKPIRNVNCYLLLRGKRGTAWFDDIAVAEDPRRKGSIARAARVTVDSSYSHYDATPINDGVTQIEGLHWTKEAWASAENSNDHFIVFEFGQPCTIARATVHWSLDAGTPRTSQEVWLQVPEGKGWRTVAVAKPDRAVPQTVLRIGEPARGTRFRLFQPKGSGPEGRRGLMWVREVELFPPTP